MEVYMNNRIYAFDQEVVPAKQGYTFATLTSEDNITCELTYLDGKLVSLVEVH